jgi:hypothetical protein
LALALAAAGCGGSGEPSKEQYEQRLQAVLIPLNAELGRRSVAIQRAKASGPIRANIAGLEAALEGAAARIARVEPPDRARTVQIRLVNALLDYAARLAEGERVVEAGDPAAVREFQEELSTSKAARDLQHSLGALRDLGYDIGI